VKAWVLQILLSEVLDVPTTIETGNPDLNINFYDPEGRFDYGVGYYMEGLDRAAQAIDCRLVKQVEGEPYKVRYNNIGASMFVPLLHRWFLT